MPQNRTQPYGYCVQNGKITIHPEEMPVVQEIYQMYAEGQSYLSIARHLTTKQVVYLPDKTVWNKNMVARILQNDTYLGTEKHPAILAEHLQRKAQCAAKPYTHTISPELKQIKAKLVCAECGATVKRRVKKDGSGRWYCMGEKTHLPSSISDQDIVAGVYKLQSALSHDNELQAETTTTQTNAMSLEVMRLQNEINLLMEQAELKVQEIQRKIMELAAMRYALCEESNFVEEETLRKVKEGQSEDTLASLLEITNEIRVSYFGIAAIQFKSGKVIARKERNA